MPDLSPEAMRAEFWSLDAQIKAIHAQTDPLREARDEQSRAADAALKILNDEINEIEAPLYELKQQQARISRFLEGKTGPAPAE